jgi:hypothetical protein
MPKCKRGSRRMRVKMHPNGSVTVSGMSYSDLRDLLTAAALQNYETREKCEKEFEEAKKEYAADPKGHLRSLELANADTSMAWVKARIKQIRFLEDELKDQLDKHNARFMPPKPELSKKDRMKRDQEKRRKFRLLFENLVLASRQTPEPAT